MRNLALDNEAVRVGEGTAYVAALSVMRVSVEGGVLWRGVVQFDDPHFNLSFYALSEDMQPKQGWMLPELAPTEAAAMTALTDLHGKLALFIGKNPELFVKEGHNGI